MSSYEGSTLKINKIFTAFIFSFVLTGIVYGNSDSSSIWQKVTFAQREMQQPFLKFMPQKYTLYQLDEQSLKNEMNRAVRGQDTKSQTIKIPMPNGDFIELIISSYSVMAPELAAKYPQIQSYKANVIGRPSVHGVLNMDELGFHGMLFMENGKRLFIDPRKSASGEIYYASYYDSDYHPNSKSKPHCNVEAGNSSSAYPYSALAHSASTPAALGRSGATLKTYRLAMSTTGEYTTYFGGSVAQALSAVNTTIARVNQVYERDLAVKLELVSNNDLLLYTNATTDPFTDITNNRQMLTENQTSVDSVIGSANYDIGHVITSDVGGGIAFLGVVCDSTYKAQGMTGHFAPVNDPFDIDYVAHEIGHQFRGNHSFNATLDGCNREATAAWEIGNGVTIMGYAGICNTSNDVSSNSIAMFHTGNLREMSTFIDTGGEWGAGGPNCGTASSLRNQQPVVNAGADYTIPVSTPFTLTGSATDADTTDSLTYSWEQMNIGTIANISDGDLGDNPLFRVFLPSAVNSRTFPQISDILNNTVTTGEVLPTTSRNLNFTLTVRDQRGGVAEDSAIIKVVQTTTPFKITSHTTASTLSAGSNVTLTWDVGGTTAAPISCSNVDISLSIDDGNTFASSLALSSPNDGSEAVIIPSSTIANSNSRFKVACSNNIFFDISDAKLTITSSTSTSNIPTTASEVDLSPLEGDANHITYFLLEISSPMAIDISVDYVTKDSTAHAGQDYMSTSGTATILAGETHIAIGVEIIGDTIAESDEVFKLTISNPQGANFPPGMTEITAIKTILNDDSPSMSYNEEQTRRLIGEWTFIFTIISTFTDTYSLYDVVESTSTPGEYNILGTDQYGNYVIGAYLPGSV
jgi:hypothetical protein